MENLNINDEKEEISYFKLNNLDKLRKTIEKLSKNHHIEIAKILKKNSIRLTENNNGIFINLNNIGENILEEIINYLKYVKEQEKDINLFETQLEEIENTYFKDNKDNIVYNNDNI